VCIISCTKPLGNAAKQMPNGEEVVSDLNGWMEWAMVMVFLKLSKNSGQFGFEFSFMFHQMCLVMVILIRNTEITITHIDVYKYFKCSKKHRSMDGSTRLFP
jgi:hypothetical protein